MLINVTKGRKNIIKKTWKTKNNKVNSLNENETSSKAKTNCAIMPPIKINIEDNIFALVGFMI